MPTYVYHCSACNNEFEAFQRITEDALTSCPQGHEGTVKRVIQPIAVMFKGEGFHINDYAPKGSGEAGSSANGSEKGSSGTGGGGESRSGEVKPTSSPSSDGNAGDGAASKPESTSAAGAPANPSSGDTAAKS